MPPIDPPEPSAPPSSPAPSAEVDDGGAAMAKVVRDGPTAFAPVYARYAPTIMNFLALCLRDRQTAEDLCQETFVRAWRAAPRFRAGSPLRPWLFRIARNLANTEMRRRRVAHSAIGRWFDVGSRAGRAGDRDAVAAPAAEFMTALSTALGRLSERLRAAFVLVRMEGRSYEDAAELLGVPVGTVKSRASAAELALRRRLDPHRPEADA